MASLVSSALLLAAAQIAVAGHGEMPLFFLENRGQAPEPVKFMVKSTGLTAYFSVNEVLLRTGGRGLKMQFAGGNAICLTGTHELHGRGNFLRAADYDSQRDIRLFSEIRYTDLYSGIDLIYRGSGVNLKSEFVLRPGADPADIRVRYSGGTRQYVASDGALVIQNENSAYREAAPVLYQEIDGRRIRITGGFQIHHDGTVGFHAGPYDHAHPLVIDPVLSYSTLFGGSGADSATAIAVNASGEVYIAGFTDSYNLPTLNPAQNFSGGGNDVFVAKLNSAGNGLIYCTYVGGLADDRAYSIAVDATGAAYVTGATTSRNFPVRGAFQPRLAGSRNAFIFKLNSAGNMLVYSSYLGGNASDAGNGIAVDSGGNAYVVGDTSSFSFPANAMQRSIRGGQDAFVAKISADGSRLIYSTYLGGSADEHGAGIAVDAGGSAWITGSTYSTDFPTANPAQRNNGGGQDAFVARLSPDGNSLLYGTYIGGAGGTVAYPECGLAIALDNLGNAFITGTTSSADFPLAAPLQSWRSGATDAFVVKINAAGGIAYSSYLGGSGADTGTAIAVDASGSAFIAGYTYSVDLPVAAAVQNAIGGEYDGFLAKIAPAGDRLQYLSYLGGNGSDAATGVALDASGNVYVAGWTLSTNFPLLNPFQSLNSGGISAFVSKFIFNIAPVNVTVAPASGSGAAQAFTFQFSDSAGAADLSTVSVLWNTSTSTAGACAVIYNRAQNTLSLFTDAGAIPAVGLIPGGGAQQNSQCVLHGAGSSVSASGNLLTLVVSVSFLAPFNGPKNIYMNATSPFGGTGWQSKGTWNVSFTVAAVSASPSSGTGASQTFALQFSDDAGADDLTTVSMIVNTSAAPAWGCSVAYNRAANTLALLTDSGAAPGSSITPGSGTQQNTQCLLSGAGSSAILSGNVLTLNLNLTFFRAFGGSRNLYLSATSPFGTTGWQSKGTWNVSFAVAAVSAAPSSGTGASQTFALQFSDEAGADDLTTASMLVNTSAVAAGACSLVYNRAANTLALLTDSGSAPGTSITPGSGTQQNSQCLLNGVGSSAILSGNTLTLNLNLTFFRAFGGSRNVYLNATSPFGTTGWQSKGTWNVSFAVAAVSSAPSSGTGVSQTFALQFSDEAGADDLNTVSMLVNTSPVVAGACSVAYNRAANTLALLTDSGAAPGTSTTPGSGTQQNSQCILNGAGSSAILSGNTLTLNLNLTFIRAFGGSRNIYLSATSPFGTTGWQSKGTWNVSFAVAAVSAAPSSGTGASQTFALQFSDEAGADDLTTASMLVNTSAVAAGACSVVYNRAANTLALLTDSGAAPGTSIAPGSGTQQNTQCLLSGAGSSAILSGNVLTLNLNLTFFGTFGGPKNAYLSATSPFGTTGWQNRGTWTVGATIAAVAVTPSSGSTASATLSMQFSDSAGVSDLTSVAVLISSSTSLTNACSVVYNPAANTLALLTDGGTAPASTITPGSGSQQNSQCVLTGSGSGASNAGQALTLTLAITFLPAFGGGKTVYLSAASPFGSTGWQARGTWTPPSGTPASATFVTNDTTTQGTWKGTYGTDGAFIVSDGNTVPTYAQLTAPAQGTYVWTASTSDVRALQKSALTGRIASTWYSFTNFVLDVNLTDGNTHQVALYCIDWDTNGGRAERIDVVDASSNAVLDTRSISGFQNGQYLVWNLKGHVILRVTLTGGGNAVASGLFFGAPGAPGTPALSISKTHSGNFTQGQGGATYSVTVNNTGDAASSGTVTVTETIPAGLTLVSMRGTGWTCALNTCSRNDALAAGSSFPAITVTVNVSASAAASVTNLVSVSGGGSAGANASDVTTVNAGGSGGAVATFVRSDTTTQGTWKGTYGSDGAFIVSDLNSVPGYALFTATAQGTAVWTGSTSDVRALQKGAAGDRIASAWYSFTSFTLDVSLTDGNTHQVALYCIDWDTNGGRAERIDVLDAGSNAVLDTRSISGFQNGQYLVWNLRGHVILRVTLTGGGNAVATGLFFSTAGSPGSPALSISKTHSGSFTQGQSGATYSVTVSDTGGAATSGTVTVTETIPTGLTLVSMSGTGWTCGSNTCSRNDALAAGSSYPAIAVTVNVSASAAASVTNQVSVSGGGSAGANASDLTAVNASGSGSAMATFVRSDTTTQGTWKGTYGTDGGFIVSDLNSVPGYAQFAATAQGTAVWTGSTGDGRALQKGAASDRIASTWYSFSNFSLDVNLTDGNSHQVGLYCVDWDTNGSRAERVDVLDASSHTVLDTRSISGFQNGLYLVWNLRGHVVIRVTLTGGGNAVASGLFFQ